MSKLHEVQKDPVDSTPPFTNLVDHYNTKIRKEGEKVLTEKEFHEMTLKKTLRIKNATSNTGESNQGILGEGKGSIS